VVLLPTKYSETPPSMAGGRMAVRKYLTMMKDYIGERTCIPDHGKLYADGSGCIHPHLKLEARQFPLAKLPGTD